MKPKEVPSFEFRVPNCLLTEGFDVNMRWRSRELKIIATNLYKPLWKGEVHILVYSFSKNSLTII